MSERLRTQQRIDQIGQQAGSHQAAGDQIESHDVPPSKPLTAMGQAGEKGEGRQDGGQEDQIEHGFPRNANVPGISVR